MEDSVKFIDVHSHSEFHFDDVISVKNLFLQEIENQIDQLENSNFSVGMHPWHVDKFDFYRYKSKLESVLKNYSHLCVGEIGVDKMLTTSFEKQKEIFLKQASIAEKYNRTVILHCVKAFNELLQIRKISRFRQPWIFHGFNGNLRTAEHVVKMGCFLSFGKRVINPSEKMENVIKFVPLENIFFETDEDQHSIEDIYRNFSEIRKIDISKLKEIIFENYKRVF